MSKVTARTIGNIEVFTHQRPVETAGAVRRLEVAARAAGVELVFDRDVTQDGAQPDVCVVFGGDGATLRALRKYAGTDVPVFAINYGRIGFLATVDRGEEERAIDLILNGDFEVAKLPALMVDDHAPESFAINEISFQRRPEINVAHISYSLAGDWVARVPCDGLIAATPAGSTAYSLSVGGPIVAWGVRGFVVNLIAPHALSSRALVAAPEDVLRVVNDGKEPVDIVIDGMKTGELASGDQCEIKFTPDVVGLAQLPGSTFYRRFRDKLLQLTS
jgi:NAD+ kinase